MLLLYYKDCSIFVNFEIVMKNKVLFQKMWSLIYSWVIVSLYTKNKEKIYTN